MRKIIKIIPFFLFISILLWGTVNINMQNTDIFNNSYTDDDSSLSSKELSQKTGIDLSIFNEDKSIIKIYKENDSTKMIINEKDIDLDELIIGKIILLIVNSIDNIIMNFNNLINNIV